MKRKLAAIVITLTLTAAATDAGPTTRPSPADRKIAQAQAAIDANPTSADAHSRLAMALAGKARETSAVDYYARAEAAVARALELDPTHAEAEKARVWVLLGRHEFAAARDAAVALSERLPEDVTVFGLLTDANVELGDYAAAERAAQWMLDLRPGNVPGVTRGAYLRELFGDFDGALEFLGQALARTSPTEAEDRAWVLTHVAHVLLLQGKVADADAAMDQADEAFPDYHYAIAMRAKVRAAQGRHGEAADLLARHVELAPHPENFLPYADALARAGRTEEAAAAYAHFEAVARAEMDSNDNANRELVTYLAGPGDRPAEAVELGRRELARRQDIFTRAAYAWALHRTGDHAAADEQMKLALAVGYTDETFRAHAAAIADALMAQPTR